MAAEYNEQGYKDMIKELVAETLSPTVLDNWNKSIKVTRIWRPYKRDINSGERIVGKFYETEYRARKHADHYGSVGDMVFMCNQNSENWVVAEMHLKTQAMRVVVDLPNALNPGQYIYIFED